MDIRILVVDDESAIRYFLERTLARAGYRVVAVESGEQALECIAAQEFDLALIDLKLKSVGGMEVLAALRRQAPATPVIILTAHASLETAVEALRRGAHDYLFKPCATLELRESVRTGLLRRQEELERAALRALGELPFPAQGVQAVSPSAGTEPIPAPSAVSSEKAQERFLQSKRVIVDPVRHVVTVDGKLLELTPIEFDLLAYLVDQAPRVVSAQELVREVQGYESEAWEAGEMARSHIYHIRSKVRAAAGCDIIRTARGVGYALCD